MGKKKLIKPHCQILSRCMAWCTGGCAPPFFRGRIPWVMAWGGYERASKGPLWNCFFQVNPWGIDITWTTHTAAGSNFFCFFFFYSFWVKTLQQRKRFWRFWVLWKKSVFCRHFSQDAARIGAAFRSIILILSTLCGIVLIKSYDQNTVGFLIFWAF